MIYSPNQDSECRICGTSPTVVVEGHIQPETDLCGVCFFKDLKMVQADEWNHQGRGEDEDEDDAEDEEVDEEPEKNFTYISDPEVSAEDLTANRRQQVAEAEAVAEMLDAASVNGLLIEVILTFGNCRSAGDSVLESCRSALYEWDL